VKWIKWILAYVFDCVHRHTTWPHRNRGGFDYVCCLDCGKELPYSMRRMSIVTTKEQVADAPLIRARSPAMRKAESLRDSLETGSTVRSSLGVKCG
jgi:hypothetical protein